MRDSLIVSKEYSDLLIAEAKRKNLISKIVVHHNDDFHLLHPKMKAKKQKLFQMIMLYDEIIVPEAQSGFDYGALESIGNFRIHKYSDMPKNLGYQRLNNIAPDIEFTYAQYLKPAVIHKIKNDIASFYKVKVNGISEYKFASMFYDLIYSENEKHREIVLSKSSGVFATNAKIINEEFFPESFPESLRASYFFDAILSIVAYHIDSLLWYQELSSNLDAVIFNPKYKNDNLQDAICNDITHAYQTVKIECAKIIDLLPSFENIVEVVEFKEKNKRDIRRLREILSELEETFRTSGKDKMIEDASKQVRGALKELNWGKNLNRVSEWTTYLSIPVAIVETLKFGLPFVSLPVSLVGTIATLKSRTILSNNNWISIVR